MEEIVVISGKGGTGKTSLTAAFAALFKKQVLCDADVDAADLHLLMSPEIQQTWDFQGGGIAIVDEQKCSQCGLCKEVCRFEAITENFEIKPICCEGCGVCVDFCPEKAISFPTKTCGQWFISDTRFGPMVHARLGIAEENSGKLVTMVRRNANKLAQEKNLPLIITDGPPGIGCPVIASVGGASLVLVVTEPTVSGVHDMVRVGELAKHFKVPAMVCVNKHDLNEQHTLEIHKIAEEMGMAVAGQIPFDPVFTDAMIEGKTLIEYDNRSLAVNEIKKIWDKILLSLN